MTDHERPLNHRGEKDAHFMAGLLKEKNIKPELILSSDAVRARTTAEIFARILNYPVEEIITEPDLYLASIFDLLKQVNRIEENIDTCFLVSHNPGISEFVYYLTAKQSYEMQTCSVYGIKLDVKNWREIKPGSGKPFLHEHPKKYLNE